MAKQQDFLAGTLRVLILSELSRGPGYGYGIARAIDLATGGELTVKPESLYPVLHRLEAGGLLAARWEQADDGAGRAGRPRKVYRLTPKGRKRWDSAREGFIAAASGALRALSSGDGLSPDSIETPVAAASSRRSKEGQAIGLAEPGGKRLVNPDTSRAAATKLPQARRSRQVEPGPALPEAGL